MTERMTNPTTDNDLLMRVREGMEVYDSEGHKLGSVSDVFAGDAADTAQAGGEPSRGSGQPEPGDGSIVDDVARVFSDNVPEVLRNRMRHNGFIRIGGGLLRGNRYALREHIAGIDGDRVRLNVREAELINP
jgi:hypothetical protein